jgi:predicted transcriptional regulator
MTFVRTLLLQDQRKLRRSKLGYDNRPLSRPNDRVLKRMLLDDAMIETAELMGTVPMKKTEILKVRVDKETHAALMQHCKGTGQSPSWVLRKILKELIQGNKGGQQAAAASAEAWAADESNGRYARSIAAILIAQHMCQTGRWQEEAAHKHHEIARLVDALLQTLCGDHDRSPTPASFPSEELPGPALTLLPSESEPKYW